MRIKLLMFKIRQLGKNWQFQQFFFMQYKHETTVRKLQDSCIFCTFKNLILNNKNTEKRIFCQIIRIYHPRRGWPFL